MLYKRFLIKCVWLISLKYKTFHSKHFTNFPEKGLFLRQTESLLFNLSETLDYELRGLRVKAKHLLLHEPENKLIQDVKKHSMAVAHT